MSDVSRDAGYAFHPVADLCAEALAAANDAARDALIRAQTAEARVAELEAALANADLFGPRRVLHLACSTCGERWTEGHACSEEPAP